MTCRNGEKGTSFGMRTECSVIYLYVAVYFWPDLWYNYYIEKIATFHSLNIYISSILSAHLKHE